MSSEEPTNKFDKALSKVEKSIENIVLPGLTELRQVVAELQENDGKLPSGAHDIQDKSKFLKNLHYKSKCLSNQLMNDLLAVDSVCGDGASNYREKRKQMVRSIQELMPQVDQLEEKLQQWQLKLAELEQSKPTDSTDDEEQMSADEGAQDDTSETIPQQVKDQMEFDYVQGQPSEEESDHNDGEEHSTEESEDEDESESSANDQDYQSESDSSESQGPEEDAPQNTHNDHSDERNSECEEDQVTSTYEKFVEECQGYLWEKLTAKRVDFDSEDLDSRYSLNATVGDVTAKEVTVKLDGNYLIVRGIKKPTRQERIELRDGLVLNDHLISDIRDARYAVVKLASARFGKFEKFFAVPRDVNRSNITYSLKNGELHISLPKRTQIPRPQAQFHPFFTQHRPRYRRQTQRQPAPFWF